MHGWVPSLCCVSTYETHDSSVVAYARHHNPLLSFTTPTMRLLCTVLLLLLTCSHLSVAFTAVSTPIHFSSMTRSSSSLPSSSSVSSASSSVSSSLATTTTTRRQTLPLFLSVDATTNDDNDDPPLTKFGRMKGLVGLGGKKNKKSEDDDGLTFRQKLGKAGLAVVLSYGAVSNMSYGISMSIAWYGFSRKTGLSPLAPDQWKPFLAVYSAFFVFNNIVRPIRFAASVAVAPYFERMILAVQNRTKLSRGWAIGLCVFAVNIVGTLSLMAFGISVASTLAGVPALPGK